MTDKSLRLSQREIKQGYRAIKHLAKKDAKRKDYKGALAYIDNCATLAAQFNWIYSDDELEKLLFKISSSTITANNDTYFADPNKWVFYDDFCVSFILAVQWFRALAESGKNILYITTRDFNSLSRYKDILNIVSEYDNVNLTIIPSGDKISRAQQIFDSVCSFNASKIILHKKENSPIQLALCSLPKQIERYLVNLSDQTFWLGSKAIDYILEFRSFGVSVSQQRRGISPKQQLLVPFYPANDGNEFQGFPAKCMNGNLIIFSGGDYYKTIDENHTFWLLIKSILDTHRNVNFYYAVKCNPEGDSEIRSFIQDNHYEDRFFFSTYRPDIFQVFANCDIFMGTCPTSGSLMSQLAAVNSKPILQYYLPGTPDDESEQAICYNDSFKISFESIEEFMNEANKLINNPEYRKSQGQRLHNAMITTAQFNSLAKKTVEENISMLEIKSYPIDYKHSLDLRWFELERQGYLQTQQFLYGLLGFWNSLLFAPSIIFKHFFYKLLRKIKLFFVVNP